MYVRKNFSLIRVLQFSWMHILWIFLYATSFVLVYKYLNLEWLQIPWVPLSIIATAVAFYIGFKNNSAYDRLWEARKIWGAIINSSRMWGANVRAFVTTQFAEETVEEAEIKSIHKELIHRHIAYLYVLRNQLLIPTSWEHINQWGGIRKLAIQRRKSIGVGIFDDGEVEKYLDDYLSIKEKAEVINFKNTATQLIDNQSQRLKELNEKKLLDSFRHVELQKLLNDFYTHQGKCERIKKFPLPRQYASMSFVFVGIFIFLLPLGLIGQFAQLGDYGIWVSIPFVVLVGWVYIMMELIGDYSENPFEGLANDIPMLSLCRVIEIDLLEMIHAENIPSPVEAKNGVLM